MTHAGGAIFAFVYVMVGPALAGTCRFAGAHVFCDKGCHVLQRWFDHTSREWIRYSCQPEPAAVSNDIVVFGAIVVVIILVALIAVAASTESYAARNDLDDPAQDSAKTNHLLKKLEDDAREVDAHIALVLSKIGGRHDP